jgi:hypothetical protein
MSKHNWTGLDRVERTLLSAAFAVALLLPALSEVDLSRTNSVAICVDASARSLIEGLSQYALRAG